MNKLYAVMVVVIFMTTFCTQKKESPNMQVANEEAMIDLEGNEINLQDFQGQVVFLNYWATWCKPCIGEMPDIELARSILAPEGVVFLAVSDESLDKIKAFKEKNNYNFTYLKLNTDFADREVYSLPTTIIYKPDGTVGLKITGALDWASPKMLETIRAFKSL